MSTVTKLVLGAMGLYAIATKRGGAYVARALLNAIIWIVVLYFTWHSLHSRVEANWFSPIYPAFAIVAGRSPNAQVSVWLLVAGLAVLLYLHHALIVRVDLGKRYTGAGWMFRMSGMSTVDVTRSSSSFRIGTDDPDGRLARRRRSLRLMGSPGPEP